MDPISFVASIASLAEATSKVVEYLHDFKEGGKQRHRLAAEVGALWLVLEDVQAQLSSGAIAENTESIRHLQSLNKVGGPLTQCQRVIKDLETKLKPKQGSKAVFQALRWPFEKEEAARSIESIHRLQTAIALKYAQATLALSAEAASNTRVIRLLAEDQEATRLLDWLSPVNFPAQLEQIKRQYCEHTCQDFLDSEEFTHWLEGTYSTLYCEGLPGSGKTMLSMVVVSKLMALQTSCDVLVLGLFCDFSQSQSSPPSVADMIAILLKQHLQTLDYVPQNLLQLYRDCVRQGIRPEANHLAATLTNLLNSHERIYIVVDGLDEIMEHRIRVGLIELVRDAQASTSLMVTSRPHIEISKLCAPLNHCCDMCDSDGQSTKIQNFMYHCEMHIGGGYDLCEQCYTSGPGICPDALHKPMVKLANKMKCVVRATEADIVRYVDERIARHDDISALSLQKPGLQQRIKRRIVDFADGVFLIAKLYMDHLTSLDTVRSIEDALARYPGDINSLYDQTMNRINKQTPGKSRLAKLVLKWTLFSRTPLHMSEMEYAVKIKPRDLRLDLDDLVPAEKLLSYCSDLVALDYRGRVRFVHQTVEEYLKNSAKQWFPDGEADIAKCCITYLLTLSKEGKIPSHAAFHGHSVEAPTLYGYARQYWGTHYRLSGSNAVDDPVLELLSSPHGIEATGFSLRGCRGLHIAAMLGLDKMITTLVNRGEDVNAQDYLGCSPLMWAASNGQTSAMEVLLASGAYLFLSSLKRETALEFAVFCDRPSAVKLILNTDPAPLDPYGKPTTYDLAAPFNLAVENSLLGIIESFLKRRDLPINERIHGGPALTKAVYAGSLEIVRIIAEDSRADMDVVNEEGHTALCLAATKGYHQIVEYILSKGAKIEHTDYTGRTPLLCAIEQGQLEVASCLCEHGANAEATDEDGSCVWHLVILGGNITNNELQMLEFLYALQRRPNLDHQNILGDTALHKAALAEDTAIMAWLLARGARADVLNCNGLTAVGIMSRPTAISREMSLPQKMRLGHVTETAQDDEQNTQLRDFELVDRAASPVDVRMG